MATAQSEETVQKVYIAYYGRPADPAGLEYWANLLDKEDGNLDAIIDSFANSEESQDLYGNLSNEETIDLIYQQMFGREPDKDGKEFYVNALNDDTSGFTLQSITLDVLNGAQNDDALIIANKLNVAQNFTAALDLSDAEDGKNEIAAYSGDNAITEGRALLNPVDETTASTTAALDEISNTIDRLVGREDEKVPDEDQVFTLQANFTDHFTGGTGDDIFRGPDADSLQTIDELDGGEGYDTLDAQTTAISAPIVNNIEKIENSSMTDTTLDMEFITGEQEVWASNNASGTHTFDNADLSGVKYLATDDTSMAIHFNSSHDLSGDADAMMLAIDDSTSTFTSADATEIEKINLEAVSGDNEATISSFTALEELMITGSGNIDVNADSTALTNVNASELTGNLDIDLTTSTLDGTLTGGSGDDKLAFGDGDDSLYGNAGADTLNGHAGDDTLNGGDGDDSLTGGNGVDTLFGGADNDTLTGDAGDDILEGNDGDDNLSGGNDNDTLTGGGGDDTMDGGAGIDILTGSLGDDTLTGGSEIDEFRFDAGDGHDTITDFTISSDIIALQNGGTVTFANSTDAGDNVDDLDSADFMTSASFFATQSSPEDYDQTVVKLTTSYTTDDIANNAGGSSAFYVVVQNSEEGHAQIWYDDDWSDSAGRQLMIELTGINAADIDYDDFGVF